MNTFVKIAVVFIAALVAIKLMPFAFGVASLLFAATCAVVGLGLSAVAAVFGGLIFVGALLAPIWVPVLVIVGIIALCARAGRNSATPTG